MAQTCSSDLPFEVSQALSSLEASLKEKFPGGVPRKDIDVATGGILHPRTCRNEDSDPERGPSVEGRFKVGRNMVYPIPGIMKKIRAKLILV